MTEGAAADCGCEPSLGETIGKVMPTGATVMNGVRVTGSTLRSIELTDSSGRRVRVGDVMGGSDAKALVIFLRHLG